MLPVRVLPDVRRAADGELRVPVPVRERERPDPPVPAFDRVRALRGRVREMVDDGVDGQVLADVLAIVPAVPEVDGLPDDDAGLAAVLAFQRQLQATRFHDRRYEY